MSVSVCHLSELCLKFHCMCLSFTSCHEHICLCTLSSIRPLTCDTCFLWTFAKSINVKQIKWSRKIQSYSLNKLHSHLYNFPLSSIRRLKPYCKLSCLMTPGEPIALHTTFCNCDKINSGGDRGRYLAFFWSLLPRSARKK